MKLTKVCCQRTMPYKDIKMGDCFQHNGKIQIKGNYRPVFSNAGIVSIDLETGIVYDYPDSTMVIPVTVTGIVS